MPRRVLTDTETRRAMRQMILAQCSGTLSLLLFKNGFMLAFLSALGISSDRTLLLLTIPDLLGFFLSLPCAYASDRLGRKRIGFIGMGGTVTGYLLLLTAGLVPASLMPSVLVAGIACFGAGYAAFSSSWFALLSPIIPPELRGRFFGRLRTAWQAVSILFSFSVAAVLKVFPGLTAYLFLVAVVTALVALRIYFYAGIPEVEGPDESSPGFRPALTQVMRVPGYMPFCAYVFLLNLFTGACPWLFGLLQKDVLAFPGDRLVLMGNLLAIGALSGYSFAGRLVDRFGTKPVFMVNHFAYAMILFLFPFRDVFPAPTGVTVGVLCLLFGICTAATSVSVSTEMLGIIPATNKSLATAFVTTLQAAGASLSGILSARVLALRILSPEWTFAGRPVSAYDSMLLGSGIMVLLLVVTLGLIPSVLRPAQWIPHGGQS